MINPLPFCGPAEVPWVAIARIFDLAAHIFVLLSKLLVDTEKVLSESIEEALSSIPAKDNQLCPLFLKLFDDGMLSVNLLSVISEE